MKNELKKVIGNLVIQLGEHSVGKCMIPGMYDPKICQELKDEMKMTERNTRNGFLLERNT